MVSAKTSISLHVYPNITEQVSPIGKGQVPIPLFGFSFGQGSNRCINDEYQISLTDSSESFKIVFQRLAKCPSLAFHVFHLVRHRDFNNKTLGTINKHDNFSVLCDFCCQESPESAGFPFMKVLKLKEHCCLLSSFVFGGRFQLHNVQRPKFSTKVIFPDLKSYSTDQLLKMLLT